MLEVKDLTIKTLKGEKEIIKDLSFTVNKNDKLAIIGEEGNGKSTLLKCIYNQELIKDYTYVTGKIIKNNLSIGYLKQFLESSWENQIVGDYFLKESPDSEIDYEKYATIYKLDEIFKKLNLDYDKFENKLIGNLSGGEKVKVQIAKILLDSPDLLLLDEPTNDIDIETLEWLENFILTSKVPIIFISHDEVLLEKVANGILHLEKINNKTKARYTYEHIGYKEYVEKRNNLIDKQYQISRYEKREQEKQLHRINDIYNSVRYNLETITRQNPSGGRLLKKKMKNVKAMLNRVQNQELTEAPDVEEKIFAKFHNEDEIHNSKVILDLSLKELKVENTILKENIHIKIIGKEKVCIVGKNGSGKTTLIKKIYDNMKKRADLKAGYMPQNYDDLLNSENTALEFLRINYTKEEETNIRTYLFSMKFTEDEINSKVLDLSGGQKAKLFIVKLILEKANVLILDEPTRNLSPLSNPVIRNLLKNFDGTIISVSHDRKFIEEVCSRVIEF